MPDGIDAAIVELAPAFAARAAAADDSDAFVAENMADLKVAGLVEAAVPVELGGRGAQLPALCDMLRRLAHSCSSTALAFSMHTHQVAIPAWRWRTEKLLSVEPLLKRIATDRIILLSSGGSDWISGSGRAERVDGGFRITARKVFTSNAPVGDLLMTGAVHDDPADGPTVLHFAVPMSAPEVSILPTWKAMGMRGTGSHDVAINGYVVPESAVALRRRQGEWHVLFHIISMLAFPLIYAVYLGVAEAACARALELARKRHGNSHVIHAAGKMSIELQAAQWAHQCMLATAVAGIPSPATTNTIMTGRSLVARHVLSATGHAMELAGGGAFYRDNGLERCFRDIQGARYHPLQTGPAEEFAGRVALGLDTSRTF